LKLLYNVGFRHAGIPGRFWYKATDFGLWRAYQPGVPHQIIQAMHEEMGSQIVVSDVAGDVIRLQPNHISFRTVDAIEDIHGSRTKAKKGEIYENVVRPPGKPANIIDAT
jgi:hypothetical protein